MSPTKKRTLRNKATITYLTPINQREQPQNIRIRGFLIEIRVLDAVTSISQRQPRRVRTELLYRLTQRQRVARTLAHLLAVEHQVTIRAHAEGPFFLREYSSVVVDSKCQMVIDEIFARGPDVHRVEIVKFVFHGVNLFFGERCVGWPWSITEDVFEHFVCHLIRCYTQWTRFASINNTACVAVSPLS